MYLHILELLVHSGWKKLKQSNSYSIKSSTSGQQVTNIKRVAPETRMDDIDVC